MAAVRQKIHLSHCSILASHLSEDPGIRFYVHRQVDVVSGIAAAAAEARRLGKAFLFLESETGAELYNAEVPAIH